MFPIRFHQKFLYIARYMSVKSHIKGHISYTKFEFEKNIPTLEVDRKIKYFPSILFGKINVPPLLQIIHPSLLIMNVS